MALPVPYAPAPSRYDFMPRGRGAVVPRAAVDPPAVIFSLNRRIKEEPDLSYEFTPLR